MSFLEGIISIWEEFKEQLQEHLKEIPCISAEGIRYCTVSGPKEIMLEGRSKTNSISKSSGRATGLKSTKSYIYFSAQKLGDGATSSVYHGRNKKNGEKVAVKVFNLSSYQRSGVVQDREFEVLCKLKHDNIVRLIAVEDDNATRQRVLIMELCDCSVLNMLGKPEYYYGFQEEEFLCILQDTTAGMKYLQDMGIVHRDIKPGNIMKRLGPDKRPSFKLADFGAARELQEGEQFLSLYGTEEYLHPDMYARALLKKTPNNPFTSKVDLWSLGVTLYHIATGILPFRPFGGRKNKTTMYEMTSKKPTGVISAVQKDSERGPIQYSTELPTHSHFSLGLRLLVTPMLAGLLESNPSQMWSFQTFFAAAQSILKKKKIHVFQIEKSRLLKIYSEPDFILADVQELIAGQTDIPADRQILAHDGTLFLPETSVNSHSYPETSDRSPIILWRHDCDEHASDPEFPCTPPMPSVPSTFSLDGDYSVSKACLSIAIFMAITQRTFFVISDLHTLVAKNISDIVKSHIVELRYHCSEAKISRTAIEILHQSKRREVVNILTFLESSLVQSNGKKSDFESFRNDLVLVREEISGQEDKFNVIEMQFQKVDHLLNALTPHLTNKYLITTWDPGPGCSKSDRCSDKLDVLVEEMQDIFETFREDRKLARLAYNDEQIHKMAKQKLRDVSVQSTSLMKDHCEENLKKSHANFSNWLMKISEIRTKVIELNEELTPLTNILTEFHQKTKKFAEKWTAAIDESVSKLPTLLQKSEMQSRGLQRQEQVVPDDDLETDGSLSNDFPRYSIKSPPDVFHLSSTDMNKRNEGAGTERMISVPKHFKKALNAMQSDDSDDTLQQSRQLMEEFGALSLSVVGFDLSDVEISDESDNGFSDNKSSQS